MTIVSVFTSLGLPGADIDELELEALRQKAGQGTLRCRAARNQRHAQGCAKTACWRSKLRPARTAACCSSVGRGDPRPLIPSPSLNDNPWLPEMAVLNEVIGAVEGDHAAGA